MKFSLNYFLILIPAVLAVEHFMPEHHVLIFFLACGAIIPLAGLLGKATEQVADRAGEGIGGFLNATLGNMAEMIIAIVALRAGQIEIVKASLAGSIIGNLLLVLGASFLAGGLRHKIQEFNKMAARTEMSTLMLTSLALILPAIYISVAKTEEQKGLADYLSVTISVVLLVIYGLNLLFSLKTHKELFQGSADAAESHPHHELWSVKKSIIVLIVSTFFIAWMSEVLVGSVTLAAEQLGMSQIFIGVIVVAIVGNAAEHSTAIIMALRNRMDLSFGIAIGSSIQIALFVTPFLVLLSYLISPQPMNLVFSSGTGLAVILSISMVPHLVSEGRSTWFSGALLLTVYMILAMAFYFIPA